MLLRNFVHDTTETQMNKKVIHHHTISNSYTGKHNPFGLIKL